MAVINPESIVNSNAPPVTPLAPVPLTVASVAESVPISIV
jgi:hypothetical protein